MVPLGERNRPGQHVKNGALNIETNGDDNVLRQTRFGLTFIVLLLIGGMVAAATPIWTADTAPAAMQSTVDAAVQAAFTQTAAAAGADVNATAAFQQTVAAAINATLTAQAPTPTPMIAGGAITAANADNLGIAVVFGAPETTLNTLDVKGMMAATGGENGIVYLWDVQTGQILHLFEHPTSVQSLRLNPVAPEIITLTDDGLVYRWNTTTGESLPVGGQVADLTDPAAVITGFSVDGQQFAVQYMGENLLTSWEYPDVAPTAERENTRFGLVDYDNGLAAYTTAENPVVLQLVRDADTAEIDLSAVATEFVEPIAFSPDGSQLIVTTDTGVNTVLDTATGETLFSYPIDAYGLSAFSVDGSLIVDITDVGSLNLINASDGAIITTMPGHNGMGIEAHFSPDGTTLVTLAEDNTAHSWRLDAPDTPLDTAMNLTPPTPELETGPTPLPDGFPPITNAEVQVAEQVFEGGRMFWVQPVSQVWVMVVTDEGRGQWLVYPDNFDETVDPETDPVLVPPEEGLIQPERGFGKLWRENPEVRDALGWAVTPEFGYVSRYRYVPGGEILDGAYVGGPGFHTLFSLGGELFRFNETDGTWQLGAS
jgi:hypothetical protein